MSGCLASFRRMNDKGLLALSFGIPQIGGISLFVFLPFFFSAVRASNFGGRGLSLFTCWMDCEKGKLCELFGSVEAP